MRRLAPAKVEHFCSGRRITASSHRDIEGRGMGLLADPPVELSGFSKGIKKVRQSGGSRETSTRAPLHPRRTSGFVYVQWNRAFEI
ncbi:hypothetical protein [Streptomyces sp. NPDC058773]|uniref:hypothetical protein n=1 Tax=Streptomyces sp. NPDC058773 TaxID=3346632 RepID=UPI003694081A